MARKPKQRPKKTGGPYLAAALLCETALVAQEGTLSIIRVLDQFKLVLAADAPKDFPDIILLDANIVLSFKSGDSPGEHGLRLDLQAPSGKTKTMSEQTITLTATPHGGANLAMQTKFGLKGAGLYWINVFLDGKQVTRIPFHVFVERAENSRNIPRTSAEAFEQKPITERKPRSQK